MSEGESLIPKTAEDQPVKDVEKKASVEKKAKSKPLPDWKPLGTIRDYFAEQIRQDGFR